MSWIRNAVSLAVEAGAGKSITRTVRSYADTVVTHAGNAVAGGARLLLPDRIAAKNLQSFKLTVKRLEEVSVSCRGIERVQLLRRWLVALKEVERLTAMYKTGGKGPEYQLLIDENSDSQNRPTLIFYADADTGDEPKTFREVFLHSQALEGITLSMILEEPTDEEVTLLLEIYGLCLTGGKEIHGVVMSSVQNLAKAISFYQDEVLIKREELLQLAQSAISGLKQSADIARIDAEACSIMEELDKQMAQQLPLSENCTSSSETAKDATVENLKEALVEIQLCSRLESLLVKKKSLNNGDSSELHTEKIEKLKVLSESLANSTSQAEKRILDHRYQKEEALNFRVSKANEVSQLEKDLVVEIEQLERQREELQESLKKVIISLNSLRGRLHNVREEREHFDEASNQLIVHLKSKEDELSRSIHSYRTEVDVVNTWIGFLEDTWVLQASYTEKKEKQVNGELQKYGGHFVELVIQLLSKYKESLRSSITCIRNLVEKLSSTPGLNVTPSKDESSDTRNSRTSIEEEYVNVEAKLLTTLSVVDTMKRQFYVENEGIYRKDAEKVEELFDDLKNIRVEFESIERPVLVIEASPQKGTPPLISPTLNSPSLSLRNSFFKRDGKKQPPNSKQEEKKSNTEESAKLYPGLDCDSRESSGDLTDWVFDDVDKSANTTAPVKVIAIAPTAPAPAQELTSAPAKDITIAPPSKDITIAPDQENNTTAFAKEISTAPPPSEENTAAPAKDIISVPPSKDIVTPFKDITTTSAQENSATAVAKDITTAPSIENTTRDITKEINIAPPSEEITTSPAQENTRALSNESTSAAPSEENTSAAPAKENTNAALAQESNIAPSKESDTNSSQEVTTRTDPTKEIATAAPTKENTSAAPNNENTSAASAEENVSANQQEK